MQDYEGAAQQPSIKIDQNSKGEAIVSVRVTPEPQPEDSVDAQRYGITQMPENAVDLWLETCARIADAGGHVAGDPSNALSDEYWRRRTKDMMLREQSTVGQAQEREDAEDATG